MKIFFAACVSFVVVFSVMIAFDVGIIVQVSTQKRFNGFVSRTGGASV